MKIYSIKPRQDLVLLTASSGMILIGSLHDDSFIYALSRRAEYLLGLGLSSMYYILYSFQMPRNSQFLAQISEHRTDYVSVSEQHLLSA